MIWCIVRKYRNVKNVANWGPKTPSNVSPKYPVESQVRNKLRSEISESVWER